MKSLCKMTYKFHSFKTLFKGVHASNLHCSFTWEILNLLKNVLKTLDAMIDMGLRQVVFYFSALVRYIEIFRN